MRQAIRYGLGMALAFLCAGCGMEGLSGPGRTTTLGYDLSRLKPRMLPRGTALPLSGFHVAVAQAGASVPDPLLLRSFEAEKKLVAKASALPAAVVLRDFGNEVPQEDPERLVALAEQMGADILVLVGGQVESDSTRTAASVADATIIGHYVLPTAKVEASGRAIAAVIAVRERRLLFTEMMDGETTRRAASVSRHRATDRAADDVRGRLLQGLGNAVVRTLCGRAGMVPEGTKPLRGRGRDVRPRGGAPVATAYVWSDGFHVGLVVPVRVNASTDEWMEIGLGERDWALDSGMPWLRGLMAATTQKEGIAVVEYLDGRELADKEATMKRVWHVTLSEDEWGRMLAALEDEVRLQEVLRDYGDSGKVVKTADGYSLFHSCHHFALGPLGRTGRQLGGGFPKPTPLLETRIDAALTKEQ